MRVVSWNLAGGSVPPASKVKQQQAWAYMRDHLGADLILAQEARATALPGWLTHEWTIVAGKFGRFRKNWHWGSVIAARPGLCLRHVEHLEDNHWLAHLYDLVVVGELDLPQTGPTMIASVHTAACSVQEWIRGNELRGWPDIPFPLADDELNTLQRPSCKEPPFINDFAFNALERLFRGGRFLAAGDWNTSRRFPGGPEFFSRAVESDWVECHREPEEQSYFKKRSGAYQLDHAFCDRQTALLLKSCRVVVDEVVLGLSDHAPLVTELGITT